MKVVSIVGARPQFIKEAPVGRLLRRRHDEVLVHTGQHYDPEMSDVFFQELEIPKPDHHLGVGSGGHGAQTGRMLERIESLLLQETPDWVLVYGDTNSTLAGAIAAAKLSIPVAHVEAGLRSFDRRMPEEVNRVLTDHVAKLLFAPTRTAVENLRKEGVTKGVHRVGDVMVEALEHAASVAARRSNVLGRLRLRSREFLLATLHRPSNVDEPKALKRILAAFEKISLPIVFPVHPRTRERMHSFRLSAPKNVQLVPPLGYLDFVALEKNARRILTDSGGIQKEAYLLGVPCVTLRDTTEWIETVDDGWNVLVGNDPAKIVKAGQSFQPRRPRKHSYGRGDAGARIVRLLEKN